MRIEIDINSEGDGNGEFHAFTDEGLDFGEHFNQVLYALAYGQLCMLMELAEERGHDPYDDEYAVSFATQTGSLLLNLYEASKDIPPLINMNRENEEDDGGFL